MLSEPLLPARPVLLSGPAGRRAAAEEMAAARELLAGVGRGDHPPALRLYRPGPTVAFSRRETRNVGHPAAVEAAERHGFEAVVRNTGGLAVVYGPGSLVAELIAPDPSPADRMLARFGAFGAALAEALGAIGVEASVGRLAGEFCPGDFSVLGAGRIKLAGTAQRLVAKAWLCSASIVVRDAAPLRSVLIEVYRALGVDWRPETLGAVEDLVDGATLDEVASAVSATLGGA